MSGSAATLLTALQVLFVGDSITVGQVADPGLGFVERIASDHQEWDVVNAGCGGATTLDWTLPKPAGAPEACALLGAFELLALPYVDADVVHILLGTNDATGFLEAAPTFAIDYVANIDELASRFSGDVFVSIPPPVEDTGSIFQARLDLYATALIQRANEPDAGFRLGADFSGLDPALVDGVHPDTEGHGWMADQLTAILVPEPGSAGLLLVGLALLTVRRRRAAKGNMYAA